VQYFGEIMNNAMILSDAGKIVKKFWLEIPDHFEFVELDEFVIMPDHIHGLVMINKNKPRQAYCRNNENVANGRNFADIIETRQCLVSTDFSPIKKGLRTWRPFSILYRSI